MLELADGTMVGPLPLRYHGVQGCTRHRAHRWVALAAIHLESKVVTVHTGLLPYRTSLALLFLPDRILARALNQPVPGGSLPAE